MVDSRSSACTTNRAPASPVAIFKSSHLFIYLRCAGPSHDLPVPDELSFVGARVNLRRWRTIPDKKWQRVWGVFVVPVQTRFLAGWSVGGSRTILRTLSRISLCTSLCMHVGGMVARGFCRVAVVEAAAAAVRIKAGSWGVASG